MMQVSMQLVHQNTIHVILALLVFVQPEFLVGPTQVGEEMLP